MKNIFDTGELLREATVSKMETVQGEGERQIRPLLDYDNLDAGSSTIEGPLVDASTCSAAHFTMARLRSRRGPCLAWNGDTRQGKYEV